MCSRLFSSSGNFSGRQFNLRHVGIAHRKSLNQYRRCMLFITLLLAEHVVFSLKCLAMSAATERDTLIGTFPMSLGFYTAFFLASLMNR